MKTRAYVILFALLALLCGVLTLPLMSGEDAARAQILLDGKILRTVDLATDQEFSVEGHNTVTVRDGAIAVTWADCPDGYCMARGFCRRGGDIVCLPNRLVIHFLGEPEVDGVS